MIIHWAFIKDYWKRKKLIWVIEGVAGKFDEDSRTLMQDPDNLRSGNDNLNRLLAHDHASKLLREDAQRIRKINKTHDRTRYENALKTLLELRIRRLVAYRESKGQWKLHMTTQYEYAALMAEVTCLYDAISRRIDVGITNRTLCLRVPNLEKALNAS